MAKPGRRPKPEAERRSVQLGIRLTPGLHNALETTAATTGRTISQEIDLRLRMSFELPEFGKALAERYARDLQAGADLLINKAPARRRKGGVSK